MKSSSSGDSTQPVSLGRIRQLATIAALAMLGYLVVTLAVDAEVVWVGLRQLSLGHWLTLIGLSLFNYACRFARWRCYLRALGIRVPLGSNVRIYLAAFAFTVSPGKMGEAVRSVYLREYGVTWSQSFAAFFVERLMDLAAVLVIATLTLQAFADYTWLIGAVVVAITSGILVIASPRCGQWLLRCAPPKGRLAQLVRGLVATLNDASRLLTPVGLAYGLGLGLAAWGSEAFGLYKLVQWLGSDLSPFLAMGIYAISVIIGAISFLPGGLGGAEAAMIALFVESGLAAGTAVLATVVCRGVTLWFSVVVGMVAIFLLNRYPHRHSS